MPHDLLGIALDEARREVKGRPEIEDEIDEEEERPVPAVAVAQGAASVGTAAEAAAESDSGSGGLAAGGGGNTRGSGMLTPRSRLKAARVVMSNRNTMQSTLNPLGLGSEDEDAYNSEIEGGSMNDGWETQYDKDEGDFGGADEDGDLDGQHEGEYDEEDEGETFAKHLSYMAIGEEGGEGQCEGERNGEEEGDGEDESEQGPRPMIQQQHAAPIPRPQRAPPPRPLEIKWKDNQCSIW